MSRSGVEQILPCPFCGNDDPYWDSVFIDEVKVFFLMCQNCGCQGPYDHSTDVAAAAWNKRV